MKVSPLLACPSCGSGDAVPDTIGGDTQLKRCAACSLVYAPEYADPDEIYVDGYLSGGSDMGFGLDIFDSDFQAFLGFAGDVRMRRIDRYQRPPGRLLDVGCGSGEVLLAALRHGWTATGVEPVAASAKVAVERGLDVTSSLLEESGLPERHFDVVTAFHVVEHMNDATAFLRLLSRYAKVGGHVFVEVPNLRSVHRRGFGPDWPQLRPLEHLSHFTPATLGATMRRAGLDDVSVGTLGFLWRGETLAETLNDVGLRRWHHRLVRLGQPAEVRGNLDTVPRPTTWRGLLGLQRLFDIARIGPAVVAAGRVDGP